MTDTSANLSLSYLAPAQAQKHVTVNESLRRLDALVQLAVESASTAAQPASPTDGQSWIVPSGKTGAQWAGFANWSIAYYCDGAWQEIGPREGWLAYVKDADRALIHTGAGWSALSTALGVSATDKILGRVSAGAGAVEEITFTDQAQQLCDDASFSAMRTTLGLGTAATQNTGASGAVIPLCDSAVTWSAAHRFTASVRFDSDNVFYVSGNPEYAMGPGAGGIGADWGGYWYDGAALFWRVSNSDGTTSLRKTRPMADNAHTLGDGSYRWSTVYAATGTINTSDAREKTAFAPLPESVKRAVRRVLAGVGVFQWLSSVATKGENGARLHVGVTAQAVREAFAAEGEDAARWALFCEDEVFEEAASADDPRLQTRRARDETGAPLTRLGIRHDELFTLALAVLAERAPD